MTFFAQNKKIITLKKKVKPMPAFIFILLMIIGCMWVFGKWMYPRPPKGYLQPQAGDIVTPRTCDYCGHSLPQYRGIVVTDEKTRSEHFFCNAEHEADYLAGNIYQPYHEKL